MNDWWKEFWSGSNAKVNSWTVIGLAIAAPFAALSFAALVYHIFYLGKGLDSPAVQLLTVCLGASTGGMGASLFSRTTTMTSSFTNSVLRQEGPKRTIKKAPE